jgi:hypothetical protein
MHRTWLVVAVRLHVLRGWAFCGMCLQVSLQSFEVFCNTL